MAEAAGGNGRGDAGVEDLVHQLGGLNVGGEPVPERPPSPPVLRKPDVEQARVDVTGRRFVFFDLETTGLGHRSHITQIAACCGQDQTFSTFVLPKIPISPAAQEITGITCAGRQMWHNGKEVEFLTITTALEAFITFLGEDGVAIVGHNIQRFDCPILLYALQACSLVERFREAVHGFADTLPMFRQINTDVENHKQLTLYKHYTGQDFDAHDAREDVRALQRIVDMADPGREVLSGHSFSLGYITDMQSFTTAKNRLLPGWMELVDKGVITKCMAEKAAGSGLNRDHVQDIVRERGVDEGKRMLKERLTNRQQIVDDIFAYLIKEGRD